MVVNQQFQNQLFVVSEETSGVKDVTGMPGVTIELADGDKTDGYGFN